MRVGIAERAAQHIVTDLVRAGYLTRAGRRKRYGFQWQRALRHPVERDHGIDEFPAVLTPASARATRRADRLMHP